MSKRTRVGLPPDGLPDARRPGRVGPKRPRLASLRKPPALYRTILRAPDNNTVSAQNAFRRARGEVSRDAAESFRSPSFQSAPEQRYQPEYSAEAPVAADRDGLPRPEAWFDHFYVPQTQEPFGMEQTPQSAIEDPVLSAPFQEPYLAFDEGPLADNLNQARDAAVFAQSNGPDYVAPSQAPMFQDPTPEHVISAPPEVTPDLLAMTPPSMQG